LPTTSLAATAAATTTTMASDWLRRALSLAEETADELEALAGDGAPGLPASLVHAAVERCQPRGLEAARLLQEAQAGPLFR